MKFAKISENSAVAGKRAIVGGPIARKIEVARGEAAFTLAEVLAALLFMAIVIPVAMQALNVASVAGEVADRKSVAARIAERVLNESVAMTNWNQASQAGTVTEGVREFHWTLRGEPWSQNTTNVVTGTSGGTGQFGTGQPMVNGQAASQTTLTLLSVKVDYTVQGKDYAVQFSTLVNSQ
jgi:hypothetical protein